MRDVITLMVNSKERTKYHSNELINWIKELDLFFKRSHEKFIPNFIFDLCEEDILFFLAINPQSRIVKIVRSLSNK